LKEADSGVAVNKIWRQHGISSATYYKWKAKYGGFEIDTSPPAQRLVQTLQQLEALAGITQSDTAR
jgi:putative transposase